MGAPPETFSVWVVEHLSIFGDVARRLSSSLRQLGYAVHEPRGLFPSRVIGRVIAIGASGLCSPGLLPPDAIVYQFEQITSHWMNTAYIGMLRNHVVWDFSAHHVNELRSRGHRRAYLCRIGSSPEMPPGKQVHKDIDVLFYGASSPRRTAILDELRRRGVRVHDGDAWGAHRDELIDRTKVVLNIHYYPVAVLEMVRLTPVLERRAFVISETGLDATLENDLFGGIVLSSYESLVDTVGLWLDRPQADRDAVAERGIGAMQAIPHRAEVAHCLSRSLHLGV